MFKDKDASFAHTQSTLNKILADFELNAFQNSNHHKSTHLQHTFDQLIALDPDVPLPASGHTLKRWQILAQVAATDLTLVKWYESHLDALSILAELGISDVPHGRYAVWAAEGSAVPLQFEHEVCQGEKNWCSAAQYVDYAVMTYKDAEQNSQLLLVNLDHEQITIDASAWHAVGMKHTDTAKLTFHQVPAQKVGQANDYLTRAGFWHGAAGVAVCWYGATVRLANFLKQYCQQKICQQKSIAFHLYYLGQVSTELLTTKALIEQTAKAIDSDPQLSHELIIRILRAQVENTATKVLHLVGQALGAAPFCQNPVFAQLAADLPVFLRQSHAAFDLEHIGQLTAQDDLSWTI